MINYNLAESMDKLNLDYNTLYTAFDLFDTLGFIGRKSDSTCTQRFLTWTGFKRFREKYEHILNVLDSEDDEESKYSYPREKLIQMEKFRNANFLEKFVQEFLFRMLNNDNSVIYHHEIEALRNEYLYKDCN